ncbi:MAG: hypothetical protein EAZ08_10230 [Cytophagales bacterium]|nr:MAG: hypothetical protein EAZ08_10230 [Cytophagales bacterium]
MNNYNNHPKGSEWAKWDLHVHTDVSKHFKGTFEELIANIADSEATVIGINDYFSLEGYEKISKHCSFLHKSTLPIVEFRMNNALLSRNDKVTGSEMLNFHIIFNPNRIKEAKTWLNSLVCFDDKGNKAQLGNLDRNSDGITIDFSETITKLEEVGLRNDAIIWLPYNEYGGIDRIIPSVFFKLGIINKSDLLGSSTKSEIEYFLWKHDKITKEQFKEWFGKPKPCVKGSDAHNSKYPIGKLKDRNSEPIEKYCWIKANPTFEGLRQIIFEPERVSIQEEHPNIKEPYYVIKSVRFIDEAGRFMNETIHLNSGLNAIIGGKSTGKSLLLHFIAKTLLSKDDKRLCEEKKGKNDKVEIKEKYSFENLDFEVEFADGKKFTLKGRQQSPDNTLIEFIPQQWLSEMVENHHKNEIESPYQKLIEKSLSEKEGYDKNKKQHDENCKEFKHLIKSNLIDLFEIQDVIKNLERERAEMGNQQDFENSIKYFKNEIDNLKTNSSSSTKENKRFEDLQNQKTSTLQGLKTCENNILALKSYEEKLQIDWKNFVGKVNENYQVVKSNFALAENNFLEPIKKSLNDLNSKFQENIKQIEINENKFSNEKENLEKQKLEVETELKPFEVKFANFKKIEDCEKTIRDFEQKIANIQKQENLIKEQKTSLETCKKAIKGNFQKLFEEYQSYITLLKEKYFVIFKADRDNKDLIELHSELGFDYDSFEGNFLANFSNKSSTKNRLIFSTDNSFDENNKIIKENYVNYTQNIFDLLLSNEVTSLDFLKEKTPKIAIESLFENRFKVDYKIKYENDWLENMSQGKKGIVLLKLYLAIEKAHYPILIDQPEDNLDNRTIYTSLIDFIKRRKIDRQIIMVTHNANLVIATDAEQVIVAHQEVFPETDEKTQDKKFKFEYVTGALEHTMKKDTSIESILYQQGIREHVCEILEGGEIAFKKREEKYGLK